MISVIGRNWEQKKTNINLTEKIKQDYNFSDIVSKLVISRKFDDTELSSIENVLYLNNVFFKNNDFERSINIVTDIIENKPKLITNYVSKNYIDLSNKIIKKQHLNLNEKPLRILQIGANNGKLLYLINKELNFKLDCWGVEKDSELVYQSYNNLFNIKSKIINVDSYQNLHFKDEFFDCVFYDQENSEIDRKK